MLLLTGTVVACVFPLLDLPSLQELSLQRAIIFLQSFHLSRVIAAGIIIRSNQHIIESESFNSLELVLARVDKNVKVSQSQLSLESRHIVHN